jgi:hypothetical protein
MPQLWIWDWSMKEVFFLQSTCRPRQNLSAIGLNCAFCIHLITGYFQWELYHTTKVSVLGKFSLIPRSDVNSILKSIVLNNTQTTKRDSILQITELNKLTVEFLNYQDRTGSVIQANKKVGRMAEWDVVLPIVFCVFSLLWICHVLLQWNEQNELVKCR